MSRLAKRITQVVLAIALALAAAAPTHAGIGLSYFEVAQGTVPTAVVVTWGTESETDVAAFVISRAIIADPQQAQVIHIEPASGSAISGDDYAYTDTGLTPGQLYFYWLAELTTSGEIVTLAVRQIVAGEAPPGQPRVFLPLTPVSTASRAGSAR